MVRFLVLVALAAALLAAGCGGSNSSSGSGSGSNAPAGGRYPGGGVAAPGTGSTAPASRSKVQVTLQNITFTPGTVHAKVGQTIVWINKDSINHNVTAMSGATFKSSDFGQGQTFSQKLTKAGTISYACTIHPGMTGKIVVTAA